MFALGFGAGFIAGILFIILVAVVACIGDTDDK
jgi:hypothetical protein